jgi:hypothetical protein
MYYDCEKYIVSDDQIVLRNGNDDPSRIYSEALEPQQQYSGKYGKMIGALHHGQVAYVREETWRSARKVDIYNLDKKHQLTLTLQPPGGRTWSERLSICDHPYSRWTLDTGHWMSSMTEVSDAGVISLLSKVSNMGGDTGVTHVQEIDTWNSIKTPASGQPWWMVISTRQWMCTMMKVSDL